MSALSDPSGDPWGGFAHDPRDPAASGLRAGDADREIIHQILGDAFAEGRLDRDEYDERSSSVLGARTLGELPPLVADLVPVRAMVLGRASSSDFQARAVEHWRDERRNAFMGFVGSALITWTIWAVVMFGGFPWPLFVNAFALLNFLRVATNKREIVAQEVRRLERRQAKKLKALEPPPDADDDG